MTKAIFGRSFAELDLLAKRAVAQAIAEHKAAGRSVHFSEDGDLVEERADGSRHVMAPESESEPASRPGTTE